jgi:hypothetical protein
VLERSPPHAFMGGKSWQLSIGFFPQILILKFRPNAGRLVCRNNIVTVRPADQAAEWW